MPAMASQPSKKSVAKNDKTSYSFFMKTLILQIKDALGTDAKAAYAFGVSLRTFQRWKRKGDFPRGIYREKAMSLIKDGNLTEETPSAREA